MPLFRSISLYCTTHGCGLTYACHAPEPICLNMLSYHGCSHGWFNSDDLMRNRSVRYPLCGYLFKRSPSVFGVFFGGRDTIQLVPHQSSIVSRVGYEISFDSESNINAMSQVLPSERFSEPLEVQEGSILLGAGFSESRALPRSALRRRRSGSRSPRRRRALRLAWRSGRGVLQLRFRVLKGGHVYDNSRG